MVGKTLLATLPGSAPHQRLQVALVQRADGRLEVDLCEQHHAEGIGWFDQRSLSLEPRQLQQLQRVLNLKASPQALAEPAAVEAAPVVLPFPGPADAPRRVAVGGEG